MLTIVSKTGIKMILDSVKQHDNNESGKGFVLNHKKHTIAAVDVERLNSIKELVSTVVTENRLKQGFDLLSETQTLTERDTCKFIKWVIDDVVKEELDTIAENGFTVKDVSSEISNVARKWFFAQL